MKVRIESIPLGGQQEALDFHTDVLGFVKKLDIPLSEENRWLTVVSKYGQDGPELLLEPAPNHFKPAKVFQEELFNTEIPWAQFYVDNGEAIRSCRP